MLLRFASVRRPLRDPRPALLPLVAVLVVAVALFVVVNLILFAQTYQSFQSRYLEQQKLLLEVASSAMEEEIESFFSEVGILATYSFREFEEGTRSHVSVRRLLEVEQTTYGPIVLYAYYRRPAAPLFSREAQGLVGRTAREHVTAAVADSWRAIERHADSGQDSRALALPFHATPWAQIGGFAYPVSSEGEFRGALAVGIDVGALSQRHLGSYASGGAEGAAVLAVTDAAGRILWSADPGHRGKLASEAVPFPAALSESSAGSRLVTQGEEHYLSWCTIAFGEVSLQVVSATPAESVALIPGHVTAWRNTTNVILLTFVAVAALYTIRLGMGRRKREQLEEKELYLREELERAANRYSLIFEKAQDGIFIMEAERIVESNARAAELFKTSTEALQGRTPWELSPELQPDGRLSREAAMDYVRRALEGQPQYFQWVHRDADSDTFTAEVSLSAIKIEGRRLVQAFVRDVSARARMQSELENRLRERTVMLQEIHHRVGNSLQVVSSILSLQSSRESDPERIALIQELRQRVLAIALAHDTMYRQSDLSTIQMSAFLTDLSMQVVGSFPAPRAHLQNDIEDIELPLETGLYLGFIAGELLRTLYKRAATPGQADTLSRGSERPPVSLHLRLAATTGDAVRMEAVVARLAPDESERLPEDGLAMELVRSLAAQLGSRLEAVEPPEYGFGLTVPYRDQPRTTALE